MKTDRRKFITTTASIIGGISLRKLRIEPELKAGNYVREPYPDLIRVSITKRVASDFNPGILYYCK